MIAQAAARLGVSEQALRAVLRVECSSDDPDRWLGPLGKPIVRVEAHHVLRRSGATTWGLRVWGRPGARSSAWQGGPGEPPDPWVGHEVEVDGAWWSYHGRQQRCDDGTPGEYDALDVAAQIIGMEAAAQCSSWGPGQVLGAHAERLGLPSALAVRDLASTPEGGLDLVCRYLERISPAALVALRRGDWLAFATAYNGPGQAKKYAEWLEREFKRAAA